MTTPYTVTCTVTMRSAAMRGSAGVASARGHPDRAVQPYHLAVEHLVFDDVPYERRGDEITPPGAKTTLKEAEEAVVVS